MSSKLQNLPATSSMASTDVLFCVTNPVTSPTDNKITLSNLMASMGLSGTNTGDETATTIKSKLGISTLSGSNTGDETITTIKAKLGITTLSGSNTGDQDLSGLLVKASNLSDLASASTARTNLGLGSFAIRSTLADTDTIQEAIAKRDTWIFSDNVIDGITEIQNYKFYSVKPLWYGINSSGALFLIDVSSGGTYGYYSSANAAIVRANSTEQWVCLSTGSITEMALMTASPSLRAAATAEFLRFCNLEQFTGVELDVEIFSISAGATVVQYDNFRTWILELGTALHAAGFKLMLDVPPIWNNATSATPPEWNGRNSQNYYTLHYEHFNYLPVDYLVPLAYDYQDDLGAGYPNQPTAWLQAIMTWIKSKITNNNRIIMGLPSAGYSGSTGGFSNTGHPFSYLSAQTGFSGAVRDTTSQELIWANAGTSYVAIDQTAMLAKIQAVEQYDISRVSIWYAGGGNQYSNQRIQPVMSSDRTQFQPMVPALTYSTDYPASGKFTTAQTNGTATYTYVGLTLATSATTTSYIRHLYCFVSDNFNYNVFDNNPTLTGNVVLSSAATLTGEWYLGLNNITVAGTGHTFTVAHIGFKMTTTGGVTTLYATQADGTTENTYALTTVSQNDHIRVCAKVISGQFVVYYFSKNFGAWSSGAALSANIPTGAGWTAYVQQSVSNKSTANNFITVSTGVSVIY